MQENKGPEIIPAQHNEETKPEHSPSMSKEEFERELERLAPKIKVYCAHLIGGEIKNRPMEEELFQEIMLRAIRKREQFRGNTEAELLSWLFTMATRIKIDMDRSSNIRFPREEVDVSFDLAEKFPKKFGEISNATLEGELISSDLYEKMTAGLTDDKKRAVDLYYKDGMEVSAIAEMMGVGESAVKNYLSRARKEIERIAPRLLKSKKFGEKK